MNRKILQVGPATLAVSIPTSWIKKFNLKKGQEISVEEQGSSIKITTKNPIEEENAILDVTALNPIATKIIGMLYKAGYKKIINYYTPKKIVKHRGKLVNELDMIKNTFDHLTGMQLWEIGKNNGKHYATIVESAKLNPNEFNNVLNKLCMHLTYQAEQIHEAISNSNIMLDEAYLNERLINQTSDFCIKILVIHGHEEYKKVIYYYDFITKLESIGDKYFQIALNYKEQKKIDKISLDSIEKSTNFIKELLSLYKKFDFDKITKTTNNLLKEIKDYEKNIRQSKEKTNLISYAVYSILLEIYELIETIYFLNHDYFKDKN